MDALREIRDMLREYFSDSKKVVIWIVIVAVLLSLWIRPKVEEYLELREMKGEFQALVDVESWPEVAVVQMNNHTLKEEDAKRVKDAIEKLEFGGRFDEQDYYDSTFTGTSMVGSLHFLVLNIKGSEGGSYSIDVCENGVYCYEVRHDFAMKNSAELYRVLNELQDLYPYQQPSGLY